MCFIICRRPKTHKCVLNKTHKSVYYLSQKCVFCVFLLKHLLFFCVHDINHAMVAKEFKW